MTNRETEAWRVQPRTRYTNQFKLDAIKKVEREPHRPLARIGHDLGVAGPVLGRWCKFKERYEEIRIRSMWTHVHYDSELDRMKRKLKRVTAERDILKKALSYFASQEGRGTNTSDRKAQRTS